jgi:hypothetical protein
VLLEFVVNADGSVDKTTLHVVRAPDPSLGEAVAKGFGPHFLPAELAGKTVRQIVQLDVPVRIAPPR